MPEQQVDEQGLEFHFVPATGSEKQVEPDNCVHGIEFPTEHPEWDNSSIQPAETSGWDHESMILPSEADHAGCRVVSKLHITPKVDRTKLKAFMVFSKDSRTFVIGSLSNNTHCTLRLEFVYDDYESHFRIEARFDRREEDINHIGNEYHRIYFYIPRRSFQDYPVGVEYVEVEDLAQVPGQVQKDVKAQTAHGKNMLYEMTFDYQIIWSVGIMTKFSGRTAEADNALQSLRNIKMKNSQVKLYFEARSLGIEAIENLIQHLKGEGYTNDKVPRPLRAVHCKKCGGEDHKVTGCPQRRCENCGETGHTRSSCTHPENMNAVVCQKCGGTGHLRKDCTAATSVKCHICDVMGHTSAKCPNRKQPFCFTCDLPGHEISHCPNAPNQTLDTSYPW